MKLSKDAVQALCVLDQTPEFQVLLAELRARREELVKSAIKKTGEHAVRTIGRLSEVDEWLEDMSDPRAKLQAMRSKGSNHSRNE
jgi:hypothetical protein